MPADLIHLVRHGEVHNPEKILYGRLPDYHLSERGRAQAQAVAVGHQRGAHHLAARLQRLRQAEGEGQFVGCFLFVDSAPGGDHVRLDPQFAGTVGEIIGIDPDAVAADQPWSERQEVPLRARRLQHLIGALDAELDAHVAGFEARIVEDIGRGIAAPAIDEAVGNVGGILGDYGNFNMPRTIGVDASLKF